MDLPVNYNYTGEPFGENLKTIGWRSPHTQLIANGYQYWNRIRNSPDSTGQLFINSIAQSLEEVNGYWTRERKEMYLETADPAQVRRFGRIPIPDHIDLEKNLNKQLLVNGSFSNAGLVRYNLPDNWTDRFDYSTAEMNLYTTDGVAGGQCMKVSVGDGERAYLGQKNNIVAPIGTKFTASIWYKGIVSPEYTGTDQYTGNLNMRVTRQDSTVITYQEPIKASTDSKWTRVSVTKKMQSDIGAVEVSIELENNNVDRMTWLFDAAMLEQSDYPSIFEGNLVDNPEWMRSQGQPIRRSTNVEVWGTLTGSPLTGIHNFQSTGHEIAKFPAYQIGNSRDFSNLNLLPTRLSVLNLTGSTSLVGISNLFYSISSEVDEPPREMAWDIVLTGTDRRKVFRYTWPFRDDVKDEYFFADPGVNQATIRMDNAFDEFDGWHRYTVSATDQHQSGFSYDLEIEAITIKHQQLYAVCKETYSGQTNRVLKIVNPRTERNKTYLEVLKEVSLNTGGDVEGVCTSVGFVDDDSSEMLLTLTGRKTVGGDYLVYSGQLVNLKYDYFYVDSSRRQVLTRELYTGVNERVVIY
jgi:hypothetical protein